MSETEFCETARHHEMAECRNEYHKRCDRCGRCYTCEEIRQRTELRARATLDSEKGPKHD